MFHAAAWGLPFSAALAGAGLAFSQINDSDVLCDLMRAEKVTLASGVPTVWLAFFQYVDSGGTVPPSLRQITVGGSAAPRAMLARFLDLGIKPTHLWGMTETSPVATALAPRPDWDEMDREAQLDVICRQGASPFGIELRIVDDDRADLPRDGATSGRLQVRGPWVVQRYFGAAEDAVDADGWFDTGDVAILHPDGTMQITDRAKDVIKSGGEWISSVDLENAAVGCPGVAEAAAIGITHSKWGERPLLIVVRKQDSAVTAADIRDHLVRHVAKWWLPDEIVFADALPHTATGKLLKTALRDQFRDYRLAGA
jgi:fatty-acyl-CoA synthase